MRAGVHARLFEAYMPAWNYSGIYDGIINGLMGEGRLAAGPCRPRVRLVANSGGSEANLLLDHEMDRGRNPKP